MPLPMTISLFFVGLSAVNDLMRKSCVIANAIGQHRGLFFVIMLSNIDLRNANPQKNGRSDRKFRNDLYIDFSSNYVFTTTRE